MCHILNTLIRIAKSMWRHRKGTKEESAQVVVGILLRAGQLRPDEVAGWEEFRGSVVFAFFIYFASSFKLARSSVSWTTDES